MAKPIYSAIASLDGYIADEDGNFDWAEPDDEVHAFVDDLERPVGAGDRQGRLLQDAGDGTTARTRIERNFDPEAIRGTKAQADRDIAVGGANLAVQAFKAGLVDECHLFLAPIVVGGGKQSLPTKSA